MVAAGFTVTDVFPVTSPTPLSMVSLFAALASKMSCVESPSAMVSGAAWKSWMAGLSELQAKRASAATGMMARFMAPSRTW